MALPLSAGGEILGVLDIQSIEANAFSNEDVPALQVLADQLATAIQNARLIMDTREALISARRATGDVSHRGWQSILKDMDIPGYISTAHGDIAKITDDLDESTKHALKKGEFFFSTDQRTISIPVITRGQTIGMLRLAKPSHAEPWTPEEVSDIEQLSIQISSALESARLYSDAQQRAARERTISEMVNKISSSTTIDSILRYTVEELGRQVGGAEVAFELNADSQNSPDPE
jgi:GAF domain-containing protein